MNRLWLICVVWIAKIIVRLSRWSGKGSGTSLPGLLVERLFPSTLSLLGEGLEEIILISGTNGKTTTRALMVEIWESQGRQVCTNRGGANIVRGLASSLMLNRDWRGNLQARTAILEVEEASLPILTSYIQPTQIILTNIFRDQLDAYGEIDKTLKYFEQTLAQTNCPVLINAQDGKLTKLLNGYDSRISGFELQLDKTLLPRFEEKPVNRPKQIITAKEVRIAQDHSSFQLEIGNGRFPVRTNLPGIYNLYNVLAALVVAWPKFGVKSLIPVENFQAVFGRGETVSLGQAELVLMLVKNPAGFDQVLDYIQATNSGRKIHITVLINDRIADGRDVSWLWDIDLEEFVMNQEIDRVWTGGSRGLDMLLRLKYAGVSVNHENNLDNMSDIVLQLSQTKEKIYVLCTYTAMLELRKELGKKVKLREITDSGN